MLLSRLPAPLKVAAMLPFLTEALIKKINEGVAQQALPADALALRGAAYLFCLQLMLDVRLRTHFSPQQSWPILVVRPVAPLHGRQSHACNTHS